MLLKKQIILLCTITCFACSTSKPIITKHKTSLALASVKTVKKDCKDIVFKLNTIYHNPTLEETNDIQLLPTIYQYYLKKHPDSYAKEKLLRKFLAPIIVNNLTASNLSFVNELEFSSDKVFNQYASAIKSLSFGLAHNTLNDKKYFPKSVITNSKHRYNLAFHVLTYPISNDSTRVFLHMYLLDTKTKKTVYYEYLIYENCNISNFKVFNLAIYSFISNLESILKPTH